MAGKLNFDELSFTSDYDKIQKSLKDMETSLINVLQDFIMQMPEFKSISNGEDGRSDFTNTTDFWKSMSKDGTTTLPDIDNLINYISENYNEKIEGKAEELIEALGAVREACIKTCKEAGEELIKRQQEMIEQNQKIIQEEKEKLAKLQQEVEKLKNKKIDLEAKSAQNPDDAKIESNIIACEERISNKEKEIEALTTRSRFNR